MKLNDGNYLIPKPNSMVFTKGRFKLDNKTTIIYEKPLNDLAKYFSEQINTFSDLKINTSDISKETNSITLKIVSLPNEINDEYYKISITKNNVLITSISEKGLFRGIHTILQLMPVKAGKNISLPCCEIEDKPSFLWRGLNLDCCRHFMSKDFVKRYIDILAHYKLNKFHWHLTEDQGWRIEIKKYPKLTSVGAWRKEADGSTYGGFYTQEDIKEVVAYAKSRFIDVIPEIEMPGHALAALAAYPEHSCTGGPFEVTHNWGIFRDIYCAGNDSTFYFLQDVLDEVVSLFPYEYIHIGGDEAPRDRWKECPKCQARMKAENLKSEAELQTYFVGRIEKYLETKGKKIIGWDEILEGGLTKGATVQSWKGYLGAIHAAKMQHNVICSPIPHCYLDYDPGYTDIHACYIFNLIPTELTADEAKFIIGSEANMWAESAPQEKIDNRLFPRLLALSEAFWTKPENKNYDDFYNRLKNHYTHLSKQGIKYGREGRIITNSISFDKNKKQFLVKLKAEEQGIVLHYTLDGKNPDLNSTLYTKPLNVCSDTTLKVTGFRMNKPISNRPIIFVCSSHKALNAKIDLKTASSELYRANGITSLVDGVRGSTDHKCGQWLGFDRTDMEAVIDLGKETEISKISLGCLRDYPNLTFFPESIEFLISNDNVSYTSKGKILNNAPLQTEETVIKTFTNSFDKTKCRFVKVFAKRLEKIPVWWKGSGDKPRILTDEIVVE